MRRRDPKRYTHTCSENNHPSTRRITTWLETPEFLRVPFIHKGYRVGYNIPWCAKSLWQVHNETVNIWTHLLGMLFLGVLLYHVIELFCVYGFVHTLMPSMYLFFAAYGLFASCVFHWFNCINATYHLNLRILDFGGITANILGAAWPISFYTFYCHTTSLYIYFGILTITSPLMMTIPFVPFFHRYTSLRTLLYAVHAGLPAYEYIHFVIMEDLYSEFLPLLFVPVFFAYLCFGTGMVLYLTRIPERFWPGAFDILGTSHQIWHVLVVVGQWILYTGIIAAARYRYDKGCTAT